MTRFHSNPLLSPVLAMVLLLGNIPAWWHCSASLNATEVDAPQSSLERVPASCCAGCCAGRQRARSQSRADAASESAASGSTAAVELGDSSLPHVPGDCVACRAAIAGMSTLLTAAVGLSPSQPVIDFVSTQPPTDAIAVRRSASSRAPPPKR